MVSLVLLTSSRDDSKMPQARRGAVTYLPGRSVSNAEVGRPTLMAYSPSPPEEGARARVSARRRAVAQWERR